ncbi:hypothetical protein AADZ84_04590 [Colwelliaceae bacterium MEBiC 14330]
MTKTIVPIFAGGGTSLPAHLGLFPIFNYVTLLIRTFMTTISREYINEIFWHNTILINS